MPAVVKGPDSILGVATGLSGGGPKGQFTQGPPKMADGCVSGVVTWRHSVLGAAVTSAGKDSPPQVPVAPLASLRWPEATHQAEHREVGLASGGWRGPELRERQDWEQPPGYMWDTPP
ncbi:DNA nucleotidylexotransferase [Platysternon megacephalum]|uniref:DNA nucleotidylexotransferase n=1 Tax=Platysternon megacephalum TaxID=55544 RepID=A0A4D9E928_9SAUR|nr:DNA nucleotidylexotransferase [Platysternon megacephalum]